MLLRGDDDDESGDTEEPNAIHAKNTGVGVFFSAGKADAKQLLRV